MERGEDAKLGAGRRMCPKCLKKGVGYAGHPHAAGYKDYARARCRYCNATFKVKDRPAADTSASPPANVVEPESTIALTTTSTMP